MDRDEERRIDVQALRDRWPVADLAQRYGVQLRGRGRQFYAHCPFHADRTPSLVIRAGLNRFRCYGCGARGDSVDWVALMEGVGFLEACERLGASRPILTPRPTPVVRPSPFADGLPGWALRTLRAAADVYHEALLRSVEGLGYLRVRGIARGAVSGAWLGYATGRDLVPGLERREVQPEAARDLGLLNRWGREVLRGRLVLPVIVDHAVVTMAGRAVEPGLERRWLDLPLPPRPLGLDRVRGQRQTILAEGGTDYLVALGWGYPVASTLGSHTSESVREELLQALEAAELVPLAFDADRAGHAAARAWADALGCRAAPLPWPRPLNDLGELGARRDGRALFARLLAAAEARWRQEHARRAADADSALAGAR